MNSVPNSDSEQCTESKTGLGTQVHTQRTLDACTMRLGRPCSRPGPCLARTARHVVLPLLCRTPLALYRGAFPAVSQHCIVTQPVANSLASVTIQNCVSRHNPPARQRGRALSALSWPPLVVSWPVSWPNRPYRGRPCAPLCAQACLPGHACQALCHNTTCCIMTDT